MNEGSVIDITGALSVLGDLPAVEDTHGFLKLEKVRAIFNMFTAEFLENCIVNAKVIKAEGKLTVIVEPKPFRGFDGQLSITYLPAERPEEETELIEQVLKVL